MELPQATSSIDGVDATHRPGDLDGEAPVLVRRLVADLPGSVHLVAEAPQPHVVGVGGAVLDAQVRPPRAARVVGVLEQVAGLLDAAGPEVDGDHRLALDGLRPADELVDADLIGLDGLPRLIEANGPVGRRADAVLPVVPGDEVAARVADNRDAEVAGERGDVVAEAVLGWPIGWSGS